MTDPTESIDEKPDPVVYREKTVEYRISEKSPIQEVRDDVEKIIHNHLPHIYQRLGSIEAQNKITLFALGATLMTGLGAVVKLYFGG
jgi:hypothetical protein